VTRPACANCSGSGSSSTSPSTSRRPALPAGEAFWELFSTSYGPTRTLAQSPGARREELHRTWVEFFETNVRDNGEIAHTREYLLVIGERR
jgi:hypothetical protein